MRALRLPAGTAEHEHSAKALMAAVHRALRTRIAVRPWPGGGILRISAQLYNRPEEYTQLATGLPRLLTHRAGPSGGGQGAARSSSSSMP